MEQTFVASRLAGNWFFRPTVTLTATGVRYTQPKFIGGNEELIHYTHIASVRISSGLFFSSVAIETSGGSAPIVINGLRNSDARKIREGIEAAQGTR